MNGDWKVIDSYCGENWGESCGENRKKISKSNSYVDRRILTLFERIWRSEAHSKKLYTAYSKKLPTELVKFVFDHLPEIRDDRDKYEKEIFAIAEKYMQEIREQYDHAYSYHSDQDSVPELLFAKKPQLKEEAEL